MKELGYVDGVVRRLCTDKNVSKLTYFKLIYIVQKGLSLDEYGLKSKARAEKYSNNIPNPIITTSVWQIIKDNLADHFVILLLIAAFISLAIGIWKDGLTYGWIDGLSIFIAVAIITIVNTLNESSK